MILVLAGGVGGAKLARGLSLEVPPDNLQIVVNTGDDFIHLGLHISPDIDTVMYWLAGANNIERGWGLADETWNFMAALERLGGPTWFQLGDRDLATHIERTRRLNAGEALSTVTHFLCRRLGIHHPITPMSDGPVRTMVYTDRGELEFQQYFVQYRCEPRVSKLEYRGADTATPAAGFNMTLHRNDLEAIVICPSNPFLSIAPILSLRGIRANIKSRVAPVVAVSPIVGGQAIKGPTAKIFNELGHKPSALEVAHFYTDLIDGLVIDTVDAELAPEIEKLGVKVKIAQTVMTSERDRVDLARTVLQFAASMV